MSKKVKLVLGLAGGLIVILFFVMLGAFGGSKGRASSGPVLLPKPEELGVVLPLKPKAAAPLPEAEESFPSRRAPAALVPPPEELQRMEEEQAVAY